MQLTFLGATNTVTGSKYLLRVDGETILVDCGLFQGYKQLRLRNWTALPVRPDEIDAVILTHAHIDHSGYVPLLVRDGFAGPIYCSHATRSLLEILLPDSGRLQEEEARFANARGFSKHRPALPLYTEADARVSLGSLVPVHFEEVQALGTHASSTHASRRGVTFRLTPAGHILGAASVHLTTPSGRILFSGDVGRPNDPIMNAPGVPDEADWFVVESTYGDRRHPKVDVESELADAVNAVTHRGSVMVVPAFAVGRAQALMLHLARLKRDGRIPNVPVYLNSPMATDATRVYHKYRREHRLSVEECAAMCGVAKIVNSVEESKALNRRSGPMIIISASGMATGGRVLHHLKAFAPNPRNMILLTGFQAGGTRGAALAAGAESIKIHGEWVPVRAEVRQLQGSSAHADADELLAWMRTFPRRPERVFVTHGEPNAADRMRHRIENELGWSCAVPDYRETVELRVTEAL